MTDTNLSAGRPGLRVGSAGTLATLGLLALLAACGGGGGDSAGAAPPPPPPPPPPATRTVSVRVDSALAAGESFGFALGGQAISVTAAATPVAFGTALAEGSSYTVSQTSGPRSCTLSTNRTGTIGAAAVLVTADCGAPAATSPLRGELRGPVGATVVLRTAAGDSVSVTVPAPTSGSDRYNAEVFTFPTALANGTAYTVSVQTTSANQTCRVYKGASGTLPVAEGALKVGCEWTIEHATRNTGDTLTGSFFESGSPAVGGDAAYGEGRFVAFMSSANLGGNSAGRRQIWWRDRLSGETVLISTDAAGVPGNGDSFAPAISQDGLTVAFESAATNLVAGDSNGVRDVFVWSAAGGTLTTGVQRVSVSAAGTEANAQSYDAQVSGDGRHVVFASDATNLVAAGVSGTNVYRRDRQAPGTTALVSRGTNGQGVGGQAPAISADGNRIAFWSFAAHIVAGDTNGLWDIFVHDVGANTWQLVSVTSSGAPRNQGDDSTSGVTWPAISGDGRWVAFVTGATNVVAGDTNGLRDLFVVDTQTLAVTRANVSSAGAQADAQAMVANERPALSHDGTWVAFTSSARNLGVATTTTGIGNVFAHNRVTQQTLGVTQQLSSGSVGGVSISRDGAYVAFGSSVPSDLRFSGSGLFVGFTAQGRAWWWVD